jgi:hypothetical protein
MLAVVTFLAQNSQEAPDDGLGIGMILLGIAIAIAVAVGVFTVVSRASRRSKGGVEPVPGATTTGEPPLEGVRRDR